MRRFVQPIVLALIFAGFLASCGGGGGGGSGPDKPGLTFTPSTATANYTAGTSIPIELTAHVTYPRDFEDAEFLFIVVEDQAEVLIKDQVDIDPVSEDEVLVRLYTSPTKPAGHYTGNFSIYLCKDDLCSEQYRGSPVTLPYDITIN